MKHEPNLTKQSSVFSISENTFNVLLELFININDQILFTTYIFNKEYLNYM